MAQNNLKQLFNIGPFRWPFYTFVAVAAVTATNFATMGECKKRLDPALDTLMEKVSFYFRFLSFAFVMSPENFFRGTDILLR